MAELTVDLTYGTALFEAARDVGKKDEIMKDADQVIGIMRDNPDLKAFISYPAISAAEKKRSGGKNFRQLHLQRIFKLSLCPDR